MVEAPNSTFGLGVGRECVGESVTVCERKMDINRYGMDAGIEKSKFRMAFEFNLHLFTL